MGDPIHVPTARIIPPRIGVPLLARERLLAALREGETRKLLILSAGAGYGKTSLLLSSLPARERPVAWFTLDESDADPNLFSAGLVAAIRAVLPDFGEEVLQVLTTGPSPAALQRTLLRGFDTLPAISLVLDDFHTVDHASEVVGLVDHLLARLPAPVHLTIATRTWPPLSTVPRLLVQGEAAVLDRIQLAFTTAEAAAFLRDSHALAVSDAQVDDLTRRTEGWPAALQLAALAARARGTPALSGTPQEIYDYLATAVLDALEPDRREFLLRTSILVELWPSLCGALVPGADPAAMLEDLSQRNLFLDRLDDAARHFRYHQLFAEFLRQRLSSRGPDEVAVLHRTAAQRLEQEGIPDSAVRHYVVAGAYADAERVMRPLHGDRLTARLAYTFRDLMHRLPGPLLDTYPWMARCGASASRFVGDYAGGLRLAQRALEAANGRDPNLWAFSVHGCAVMLSHMNRFEDAVRVCRNALDRLNSRVEPRWQNAILTVLTDAYLTLGRLQEAAALVPRIEANVTPAATPGRGYTDNFLRAMLASTRLEFAQAAAHLQRALAGAEERGSLTYQTLVLAALTAVELARRNEDAAREILRRAQTLHGQTGERATELELAHLAGTAALLAADLVSAEQHYQRTLQSCRDEDVQEPRVHALAGLAAVARRRGNLAEAESLLTAAATLCEQIHLGKLLPQVRLRQVSLLDERHQIDAARRLLAGLRETFQAWDAPAGLARVDLWEARLRWRASSAPALPIEARDHLTDGLRRATHVGEDLLLFLVSEASWIAPLLIEAIRSGSEAETAAVLLQGMGPYAVPALVHALDDRSLRLQAVSLLGQVGDPRARRPLLRAAQRDRAMRQAVDEALTRLRAPAPTSLRIHLFGTFEAERDGELIGDQEWKTRQVRTLLKYLLLQRHRPVSQDELVEILWPGRDPTSGAANLKTTVKTLRQVLEPLLEGARSTFIVRSGQSLRFVDAGRCWLDVDEYDRLSDQARDHEAASRVPDAIALLDQAVALYRGDLLEGDRYEDWSTLERERWREIHLEVLERLSALHVWRRDYRRAIDMVQRILALDRLRETAYRLLMQYALARGDGPAAIRAFQTCERLLREELGVAPQPDTTALYERARAGAVR